MRITAEPPGFRLGTVFKIDRPVLFTDGFDHFDGNDMVKVFLDIPVIRKTELMGLIVRHLLRIGQLFLRQCYAVVSALMPLIQCPGKAAPATAYLKHGMPRTKLKPVDNSVVLLPCAVSSPHARQNENLNRSWSAKP